MQAYAKETNQRKKNQIISKYFRYFQLYHFNKMTEF